MVPIVLIFDRDCFRRQIAFLALPKDDGVIAVGIDPARLQWLSRCCSSLMQCTVPIIEFSPTTLQFSGVQALVLNKNGDELWGDSTKGRKARRKGPKSTSRFLGRKSPDKPADRHGFLIGALRQIDMAGNF